MIGEEKQEKINNIFPLIIDAVFSPKIYDNFRNDWEIADGTCIRDFIHVMMLLKHI